MNFLRNAVEDRIRLSHASTPAQVLRRHTAQAAALATTNVRGTKGSGRRS